MKTKMTLLIASTVMLSLSAFADCQDLRIETATKMPRYKKLFSSELLTKRELNALIDAEEELVKAKANTCGYSQVHIVDIIEFLENQKIR